MYVYVFGDWLIGWFDFTRKQLEKEEEERKERERRDEEQRLLEEEKSKGKKGRGAVNKVQQLNDQIKSSPGHGPGSRPDSAASVQLRQGSLVNPSAASIGSNTDSTLGKYVIIVFISIHVHVYNGSLC